VPFSREQIVLRASEVIVRIVRNHVEENRGGFHTRLFEHVLHPERHFVCIGKSQEAALIPESEVHPEHVVPCLELFMQVKRLVQENKIPDHEISALLKSTGK